MAGSSSSSQKKLTNSNEEDSTDKNSGNRNLIVKSTIKPFTKINVQPTTSKCVVDESAIKPFAANKIIPPFRSENEVEKKKSVPFRYCTPDCKGAHKKILIKKPEKKDSTTEEHRIRMKIFLDSIHRREKKLYDDSTDTDTSEYTPAEIDAVLKNFYRKEEIFKDEITDTEVAASLSNFDRDSFGVQTFSTDSSQPSSTEMNSFLDSLEREKKNIDDKIVTADNSELSSAELNSLLDSFDREDEDYEAEIALTDILAASLLQRCRIRPRESDTE